MLSRRSARGWLIAYLAVSLLDVLGHGTWLHLATKPLLMPLLLAFFLASLDGLEHRLARWVRGALLLCWAGDVLLLGDGDLFFALGLVAFLGAQVCYIAGFRPYAVLGPLRRRPWLAVPYLVCGAWLLALLWPDLGGLVVPVTIYTAALVLMALLATGVSPVTAAGAILFVLSDSILALTSLADVLPASAGWWIMPTYLVGQLLIVVGVLQNLGRVSRVRDVLLTA